MNLLKGLGYWYLVLLNFLARGHAFERIPEPSLITDAQDFVDDYNRASRSVMMLPYVLALQTIRRCLGSREIHRAVDLCCGPGHFTRLLAQQNEIKDVVGIDLSAPMLDYARQNALQENLATKIRFQQNDVTELNDLEVASVDLVTFLNGAHHLNSIADVRKVLQEAERVTQSDGLILLLDPVRQKTRKITELYHAISGVDYVRKGMTYFNLDFYHSLLASWTTDELLEAIPKHSSRDWVQIVPFGVQSFQMLIGLPHGQKKVFSHKGMARSYIKSLIPQESWFDWFMFNFSFTFASCKLVNNSSPAMHQQC